MTLPGESNSELPTMPPPSDDQGRYIFAITSPGAMTGGRYGVSCWRDRCWRGMVVADSLEEAALAAVRWHVTGEMG